MTKNIAYLLGLITGRGHFFNNSNIIAIEFSHKNEFVSGISHCPQCGFLATKNKNKLKCKNPKCGIFINISSRKKYNQPQSTINSIKKEIIPYLKGSICARFEITGNKSMTILVIDFKKNKKLFNELFGYFNKSFSYDNFHIPKIIYDLDLDKKKEFVNGLLDTSGFPSPGGWLNRDGRNGHGRMRVYFQLVRNWYLPVEIDNFLRSEFNLPVHTIDWGHPNIRDANMKDYFNSNPTSWSREHQVKFFPEYYRQFRFRIDHKKELFEELLKHNLKVNFENKEDWFPPVPIKEYKRKPYHPGEKDQRIPLPARKHFDVFWQINLAMGCVFLNKLINNLKYPECFKLTGEGKKCSINLVEKKLKKIYKFKEKEIVKYYKEREKKQIGSKKKLRKNILTEKNLYEPIRSYLEKYLLDKYNQKNKILDTSKYNLDLFLKNSNKDLLSIFDYCEKYRIKPDIVAFLLKSKEIIFVEVKITPLDIKSFGQLLGYCLVAKPKDAILVSNKKISNSLLKTLKANSDLLEYDNNKKIKIGFWDNNQIKFEKI